MEHVSPEMNHFFESCEILLHEMSPQDFSDKECNLIEHYCLELYVRYGSRRANDGEKSATDHGEVDRRNMGWSR